jgi:hypothetical protein
MNPDLLLSTIYSFTINFKDEDDYGTTAKSCAKQYQT